MEHRQGENRRLNEKKRGWVVISERKEGTYLSGISLHKKKRARRTFTTGIPNEKKKQTQATAKAHAGLLGRREKKKKHRGGVPDTPSCPQEKREGGGPPRRTPLYLVEKTLRNVRRHMEGEKMGKRGEQVTSGTGKKSGADYLCEYTASSSVEKGRREGARLGR